MCIVSELFTFNTGETGALWETPQDSAWPWPDKFLIFCEGELENRELCTAKLRRIMNKDLNGFEWKKW
jgi:hypothetical protein